MHRRFPVVLLPVLVLLPAIGRGQTDPLVSRTKGAANAPVTVYEMSDFQCPFCKRHAEQTFPALDQEYIATGKVRWIYINLPLPMHRNAAPAAEFAMCAARQGKFWPAHDLLFRHQSTWAERTNPSLFFLSLADSLRATKDKMRTCLEQGETREEIKDDAAGAMRAGANSTPTFYVEGGLLTGAFPPEVWRPILDSVYRARRAKP
ncbi:MAG TPA: thioredoxin domain-containing protein [Gemmatimonadales bacterium]|nr:thioredoxin domain-containing protein [Gemmatimonadales bacterium]